MSIRLNKQTVLNGKNIDNWEEMEAAYRKRIETYGLGHKAVFYSSEMAHSAKLAHISKILHSIVKANDSVLEVGSGIGALVPFVPPCIYTGIDLVREFVEEARSCYPDLEFKCANVTNVTENYDWIILAGITGTVPMPETLISKAWELAKKGIIVDFIDSRKYQENELNTYKMGACTEFFLDMGAQRIELYQTRNIWNIYVLHKHSLWL